MKVKTSVTLERRLGKKIDADRGSTSKSAFINQLCEDGFKYRDAQK